MNPKLDLMNTKAVLFDMDGTMVDNLKYHKKAWGEFYKKHHMQFSEEDFRVKFSGKTTNKSCR